MIQPMGRFWKEFWIKKFRSIVMLEASKARPKHLVGRDCWRNFVSPVSVAVSEAA